MRSLLPILLVLALAGPVGAAPPPSPVSLAVTPAAVRLDGRRDARQLLVTAAFPDGGRDVTRSAAYTVADPRVARVSSGRVQAVGDGSTVVAVRLGGREARVPVSVRNHGRPDPVRFKFETLAVLTKHGCASGSCHGSPHGKGGFSLSLFGYDPQVDRISLTRDGFNRRVNVLEPADSLLLKKPLLELTHGGGRRLRRAETGFTVLRDWIAEGARADLPAVECVELRVSPSRERVLGAPGRTQQLAVVARFSDGAVRDVTPLATYETSHPEAVTVDGAGLVRAVARGQAAVSIRYLDRLESVHFTVIDRVPGFAWPAPPEANEVDRLVHARLRQLQVPPSGDASDGEYLRRVSLDLTGLLPTAERARRFLADGAPDRRARVVEELLASEEFARFWALQRADLMRVSPARLPEGNADAFAAWLTDAFRRNVPYDRLARDVLTAAGNAADVAPANYYLAIPSQEERTEMTAQIFMGSRLECARCHNHPFENWTMRDYYRIAAVFARTGVRDGTVATTDAGEARHPTTKERMAPWGDPAPGTDRRAAFAAWLTRPDNPYFARVEVNRIWAALFGRGIVEPVDDFRSSNPPANPALLDWLAGELVRSGYDRRHVIRLICNSHTYQRSARTVKLNEADETLFSHARVRLLSAEQLRDALGQVTGSLPPLEAARPTLAAAERELIDLRRQAAARRAEVVAAKGDPNRDAALRDLRSRIAGVEARLVYATQRPYPAPSPFATAFGQPARETACTCERRSEPTLLQALELLNGGAAYAAARAAPARYAALENSALVEELYLAAYSRLPTEGERAAALEHLAGTADRAAAVTDLVWAVLNTREFLFQH